MSMKDELLNLQCQLFHELKEWHEDGTDHYNEASALLYKSQRAAIALYADIYNETADKYSALIQSIERIHDVLAENGLPNDEIMMALQSITDIMQNMLAITDPITDERTASTNGGKTV